jgi:hypothetical protein
MGKVARRVADRSGKPLLFVHDNGVVHHLMGAPVRADAETGRAYPIPVPAKTFGAILAVGVLERLRRPSIALREWERVADRVFVIVPSWWSPHAWLDPTVRWMIDPDLSKATPLWTSACRVHLLKVSDSRYGTPRCAPMKSSSPLRSPSFETTRSAMTSTSPRSTPSTTAVTTSPLPETPVESTVEGSPYPFSEVAASPMQFPSEGSPESLPSDSWSFARELMVISSEESDES